LPGQGLDFDVDHRRTIDVQRIFYKMEPRTLIRRIPVLLPEVELKAHDAMEDVRATIEVLDGQLAMYENVDYIPEEGEVQPAPIRDDVKSLSTFTNDQYILDATQRLRYDHNGTVVFNFGKYIGRPWLKYLSRISKYYHWMLNKEFSFQVKKIIKRLVTEYKKENLV
jgi:DNA polymerase-3 subunit epsilon